MDVNNINIIRIILLGNVNIGKTSLCNKLKNKEFNYEYHTTIGVDFHTLYHKLNNINYKLQIWDTAGQEKFRSLVSCYFRKSNIIIIMFDMHASDAYTDILYWRELANQHANPNSKIILVGNKCDLQINADMDVINEYAIANHFPIINISVKTDKSFTNLLNLIIENVNINININNSNILTTNDKENKCCIIS